MMERAQAKGAPFAGPYVKERGKPRVTAGTLDYGRRPWTGITAPWCEYCSWAYRGVWPGGGMEVKYANSLCPVHRLVLAGLGGGQ